MKESYPYFVLPQKVEKIKSEGIPLPPLPQLLPLPEPVKRKYIGTIIFVISLTVFIGLNVRSQRDLIFFMFLAFFISLISLVASIFEFVQFGKLSKQYALDLKLFQENKEAFKKIKANQEKIIKNNKDENLVKKYQLDKITEFFSSCFDTINAIKNEYSLAKKRYKLFLDEYFPDEILDNVRIIHSAKNLEYVPDFIIKFAKPKLNLAIEIEEPYSLSNIPENIQKDYDAKDRIRQRFANELGWIVIVISEEQAIKNPIECCKYIEETVEYIFGDSKDKEQFVNIQPIKKQKMLTGEERAHMKSANYREKYLIEAGLMEDPDKEEHDTALKMLNEKKEISAIVKENISKKQAEIIENPETKSIVEDMKTNEGKKESIENEQLMLIKKVAQKMKPENGDKIDKVLVQEPIKIKTENVVELTQNIQETNNSKKENFDEAIQKVLESEKIKIENENVVQTEFVKETITQEIEPIQKIEIVQENLTLEDEKISIDQTKTDFHQKIEELRNEDDILKDLYNALDKHSKKQQERKDKRLREKHSLNGDQHKKIEDNQNIDLTSQEEAEEIVVSELQNTVQQTEVDEENSEKADEMVVNELEQNTIKEEHENGKLAEIEKVTIDGKLEETILEEKQSISEQNLDDENIEEMESKKFVEESLKAQSLLNEAAQKNQVLIDEYREKIEGAVFDKTWDELIKICNEAIEVLPFWDWPYYRRSTAWGNKKDFEKVIEDCNKAVSFNPTLADAYYNRGTGKFFTGRYREAADDYQKAIALNYIKKADAYFNKGLCFQKMDYHKKAYLEFMKAKEMGSKKAEEVLRTQYD